MESNSDIELYDDTEALFAEAANILDSEAPSIQTNSGNTPPDTGKTPTTHVIHTHEAALAAAVDGGRGVLCVDSMPSQGLHVIPPN